MKKSEIRETIRDLLLEICDNVQESFVHPVEYTELQGDFPYLTMTWGLIEFQGDSNRAISELDIIGIIKGDEDDLIEKRDELERDVYNKLYKNDMVKLIINDIDDTNLFRQFGIQAGVFPPYAGFAMKVTIPNTQV